MHRYEVIARNPATESENRIHADDIARKYGFAGGLVPGVTVFAYACAPIVQALGNQWINNGSATMRFLAPCYDGERLQVSVEAAGDSSAPDAGEVDLSVKVKVGDRRCASGTASPTAEPLERGRIPRCPRPADRPLASEEVFSPGRTLGTIRLPTDAETMAQYLESIEEPNPVYLEHKLVHPGMLLNGANWVLVANVVMPAWIHAESTIRHFRAVPANQPVEVRARIVDSFERRHRFAVIDVDWVSGADAEDVVASGRHTFIWKLGEASPTRQK